MIKYSLLICFILSEFFTTYGQIAAQNITKNQEITFQENQIIKNAQKAIKIENKQIKSIYIKSKLLLFGIPEESIIEISLLMPDKVKSISARIINESPFNNTKIWNGINYQNLTESEIGGQKIVRNITESSKDNQKMLERLEGRISKEKLEKYKNSMKVLDPKESLNNKTWGEIFPFILENSFEENLQYKYVGKTESKGRIANIIDVKSKYNRNYRLLFDSETSYLIMMIESFKGFDGDYEDKYYYSNRELVDNILIPRLIKVERKFTPTGKAPNISYENIEIVDFKLNPVFKESIFEIK